MRAQHGQETVLPLGEFFGTANVKKELAGFSISRMAPVVPAAEMQIHTHEQATFVMVLDGLYISSALNAGPRCRAPTLIYNPPGTTHRDRFEQLSGQFLGIAVSSASLQHAVEYAPLPDRAVSIQSSVALSTGRRLAALCDRVDEASPLLAEGLCWELMAYAATASRRPERRPPAWLQTSKELLQERCNQTFGVADAAREIGVHPVHFVRTFRRFFHCTPGEYLRWCRIEKAKSLLTSSSLSLAEAALESGYADQSQLCKAFKRHFGLSPGEYRRSCRHAHAQN
ncbi:MAG TPA: AraC family transcriptional regulator [Myxococcaceae bacterium]|nr:AraC family transcriptional regulator [Myxococcaceae bacterium]